MRSKDFNERPVVLRELSLLRALGTSLRTSSYRSARLNRAALPFSRPPQPAEPFASLPVPPDLLPLPTLKTPLDQVSKLK